MSSKTAGTVYFLYEKTHGLIKIGYTLGKATKRAQATTAKLLHYYRLGVLMAPPDTVILCEETCRYASRREQELHQILDHLRPPFLEQTLHPKHREIENLVGAVWGHEWFEAVLEIFELIDEIKEKQANELQT